MNQQNVQQSHIQQSGHKNNNKSNAPTCQNKNKLNSNTQSNIKLNNRNIRTLNLMLKSQKINKQIKQNSSLQNIFQSICNSNTYDKNNKIVQKFIKYCKTNIQNGQILLTNNTYTKYFQQYIFGHIRQPYPKQQQIINKQSQQQQHLQQSKTTIIRQEHSQQLQKQHNNPKIQQQIQKLSHNICKQIGKEIYNHVPIQQLLNDIFAHYQHIYKVNNKQISYHAAVWQLLTSTNNTNNNLYFRQLIYKILEYHSINKQISKLVVIQGWLSNVCRKFIIQYIIQALQSHENNSSIDKIYLLCNIIHAYEQQLQSNHNNNLHLQPISDWYFIKYHYLDISIRYSQYCIKQFINTFNNGTLTQLIQFVGQLSPTQVIMFHRQLKLHNNIIQLIGKNQQLNANMDYLQYIEDNKEDNKNKKILGDYFQKQIQKIKSEVLHNSYPTQKLIINSYINLTNMLYKLNSLPHTHQYYTFIQQINTKLIKIVKQFHKNILQLFANQPQQSKQVHYLQYMGNYQRMQLYFGFVSKWLPQYCSKFNQFIMDRLCDNNINISMHNMYYMLTINTINIKQLIQNNQQISIQPQSLHNIITNINKINKHNYHLTLIHIQLLKYLQQLSTNIVKTNQQKLKQIVLQIINHLYCQNSHNIVYSYKVIQLLVLICNKISLWSNITQTYISQYINMRQQYDKIRIYMNKYKQNNPKYHTINTHHKNVPTITLQLSQSIANSHNYNHNMQSPIIKQLLGRKSQTIAVCSALLSNTQQNIDQYLSYLVSDVENCVIYNLHQYDNIGIKYSQVLQHNTQTKQSVFYSDMYRNHSNMYIYLQILKLYLNTTLHNQPKITQKITTHIKTIITQIKRTQPLMKHNSGQFYHILNLWKFIYCACHYKQIVEALVLDFSTLGEFNMDNCCWILWQLLNMLQLGNIHPLIRQYISAILSLVYRSINDLITNTNRQQQNIKVRTLIKQRWKQQLLKKLSPSNNNNISINIFIPIIFTLGNQMISFAKAIYTKHPTTNKSQTQIQIQKQCQQILDIMIRYISCHHAYIRSIVQYYIMKKMDIQNNQYTTIQQQIKIPHQQHINQHPITTQQNNNSLLEYLCDHVWKKDKDCIKIMRNVSVAVEGFHQAMGRSQSLEFLGYERVQQYPNQIVIYQFRKDLQLILKYLYTNNQQQLQKLRLISLEQENTQYEKQQNTCNGDQKIKYHQTLSKFIQNKLSQLYSYLQTPQTPLILEYKRPEIIIIATLLQKVHNFGYILRTLHQKRAMLLIPSKQLLQHPECQQFIPKNSQIQVIQIKQNQLDTFIKLNKKLGYPLIGLQQCAGSVKIEEFQFPNQYMLLLGNERIGAPASLLNQTDVLVEIPQVGKVRSLNVHVSMVICVWQSIIKNIRKDFKKD